MPDTSRRFAFGASNVCLAGENSSCSVPVLQGCEGLWYYGFALARYQVPPPASRPAQAMTAGIAVKRVASTATTRVAVTPSSTASTRPTPLRTTTTPNPTATAMDRMTVRVRMKKSETATATPATTTKNAVRSTPEVERGMERLATKP